MKKSRNFTWLILGIITIILGIVIPLFAFNRTVSYEYNKDAQAGQVSFYIVVTSKEQIKDVQNAIVNIKFEDGDTEEYETYFIKQTYVDGKFKYEFKIVETDDWEEAQRIESVKLRTIDGVVEIDKSIDWETKIPLMIFSCVIGAFMIVVNFINNNSKDRANELKEILASSAYNDFLAQSELEASTDHVDAQEVINEIKEELKEELKGEIKEEKVEATKTCEYCDSPLVEFNIKIWSFSDVEEVK